MMFKSSFYGSKKWSTDIDLKVRLAKRERAFAQASLPSLYKPRITGPNHAWKIFSKQCDAFKYRDEQDQDLHVFSFESEKFKRNSGQRSFLVTSYEEFWHYYSQLTSHQRHHYEVIPEGAKCHLYFDLEFLRKTNPGLDGTELTQCFIRFVLMMLNRQWSFGMDESHVLQLDASTIDKFSRHLIFRIPGAVFDNNVYAGNFVKYIINILLYNVHGKKSYKQSADDRDVSRNATDLIFDDDVMKSCALDLMMLKKMVVKNQHGKDTLFCDMGVYTKNRNFRLYLSCKLGKNNPMVIASENKYKPEQALQEKLVDEFSPPKIRKRSDEEAIFLASLITNIRYDENTQILQFEETVNCNREFVQRVQRNTAGSSFHGSQAEGNKSPFPEIDDFILSLVNHGGKIGRIRRWTFNAEANMLLYDIADNRWCENIDREHKSNNIMLIADLKKGVYYQKCHDPECKMVQYKSQDRSLPMWIMNMYSCEDLWDETAVTESSNISETFSTRVNVCNILKPTNLESVSENREDSRTEELSDKELLNLIANKEAISCNSRLEHQNCISSDFESKKSETSHPKTSEVNCDTKCNLIASEDNKNCGANFQNAKTNRSCFESDSLHSKDIKYDVGEYRNTGYAHEYIVNEKWDEFSDADLLLAVKASEEDLESNIFKNPKGKPDIKEAPSEQDVNCEQLNNESCSLKQHRNQTCSVDVKDNILNNGSDILLALGDQSIHSSAGNVSFDNDFIDDEELLNATLELEVSL